MPGACQNSELVVGSASMTHSHLSLPSACSTWLESGPMLVAVMPDSIRPSILPCSAWSKIDSQDALAAGLGRWSKANSLRLRGRVAVPGLEQAHQELAVVLAEEVQRVRGWAFLAALCAT